MTAVRDKSKSHGEKQAIVLHENEIHFSCQWRTCEISHHHIFPRCLSSTSHALRIRQVFYASDSLYAEHQLPTHGRPEAKGEKEQAGTLTVVPSLRPRLKKEFHFSTGMNNDMHKFSVQQAWMALSFIWSEPQLAHLSPDSPWKLSFVCPKPVLGI